MDLIRTFPICRLEIPKSLQQNPFSLLAQASHGPFSPILHLCSLLISLDILFSQDSPVSPLLLPQVCYFYSFFIHLSFTLLCLWSKEDLFPGMGPPPCLNMAPLCCFYPVLGAQLHPNNPVSSPTLINIRPALQSQSKSFLLALWSPARHLIL